MFIDSLAADILKTNQRKASLMHKSFEPDIAGGDFLGLGVRVVRGDADGFLEPVVRLAFFKARAMVSWQGEFSSSLESTRFYLVAMVSLQLVLFYCIPNALVSSLLLALSVLV